MCFRFYAGSLGKCRLDESGKYLVNKSSLVIARSDLSAVARSAKAGATKQSSATSGQMDCFASGYAQKRFAGLLARRSSRSERRRVARNDDDRHGISYTSILSAMPRSAACFWIGLIASFFRMVATSGASITGAVTWISCDVESACTREAILTV